MDNAKIAQRFARDTADHVMTILHDDGLYRHLRFTNPEHPWNYWFDLITAPGTMIFEGDGESFVFRRLEDMFEFFRDSTDVGRPNIGYWAEKVTSDRDGIKKYDRDILEAKLKDVVAEHYDGTTIPPGLTDAIQDRIIDEMCDDETYDRKLVDEFTWYASSHSTKKAKKPDFQFGETFEWHLRDYRWWFLWALHAILWGIGQYDAAKATTPSEVPHA